MSARFDPRTYRDPAPRPWLIRLLGPVNRHVMLGPVLRLRGFDLPDADLARLRAAVNPKTAAFLGPNHPEFLTDWLVDKEISRRVSPLMAHWASYEIVNGSALTQRFWLANNLIANAPGGGGKAYSIRWARAGHGVLLHPEGTATWQGDRVGPLLPGIVDMAWDAACTLRDAGDARPVYVVPLVWRLRFVADPVPGLHREMASIERELGLPAGGGAVEARFAALLGGLLARQCARLGLPAPAIDPVAPGAGYFAAQQAALAALRAALAAAHGPLDEDPARAQHRLRKALRVLATTDPEGARRDRERLAEMQRLHGFDPELYDRPALAPERMAEVLKRTRSSLLTRGLANALHNTVPVAVGPRAVHVRVPEPFAVHEALAAGGDEGDAKARLLAGLHARLQRGVDDLRDQFAADDRARERPNPLASGDSRR
jgi:hypothetical protein